LHTLGRLTMQLFYATDFADRLENQMLPALRAGFIVLTDRYIYSAIARAIVRGADPDWVRAIYGIALVPDAVFYLNINSAEALIARVLASGRGFDYWESGMDLYLGEDFYDSFVEYQTQMLREFEKMKGEYGFRVLNATRSINRVAADLRRAVARVIDEGMIVDKDDSVKAFPTAAKRQNVRAGKAETSISGGELKEGTTRR
jgi:dTMP kinase